VKDPRMMLSTLWVFAMFNYLYADVLAVMDPELMKLIASGSVGVVTMTQGFLLGAAMLMETAIAMVLLSRILSYRANRIANIAVGFLHTAAVAASMFVGSSPTIYYIFFACIEIPCTLFIVWYAWKWRPEPLPAAEEATA
jgi:hypothetical protein